MWRSSDLSPTDWSIALTNEQRDEIATAARAARSAGIAPSALALAEFSLSTMEDAITEWSRLLSDGRAFVLLRRFPIDQLADDEIELAYVGLGLHLGKPVTQNAAGELLTHIRDERLPESGPQVRLYRTRERQDFHTDGADIIGLLCVHSAKSGGESRIVSSGAVYNEMLRRRPDLVDVLYRLMYWDRQGDDAAGGQPWFELAPISDLNGTPRVFYIGWYIRDAQRHPDVPRLTGEQCEAMELLESIANDPTFHLEMDFAPGDVQLLNNGKILHSREAYEDEDDPAQRRHLLRLWLAAHRFTSVDDGLRGGIRSPR